MSQSFQPIWVSTIDHMEEHARITERTSKFGMLIGRYACPDNFPHIQLMGGIAFYTRIPIVYCQYGELTVGDGFLAFGSQPPRNSINRVRGDFPTLNFQLRSDQIQSVEEYRYPKPFLQWANLDWVRIRTREDVLGGDFLMCVGGTWPKTIQQKTAGLMSAVQAMVD